MLDAGKMLYLKVVYVNLMAKKLDVAMWHLEINVSIVGLHYHDSVTYKYIALSIVSPHKTQVYEADIN